MKTTAFVLSMLLSMPLRVSYRGSKNQLRATRRWAVSNVLRSHGSGDPVVLLPARLWQFSGDWNDWIDELSKTRKVIAVEMQGHGAYSRHQRESIYENLSTMWRAARLSQDPSADIIGYSLGAVSRCRCAIRHPEKCERSSAFQPRSAATVGSRKRTTFGRHSRGKYSKHSHGS